MAWLVLKFSRRPQCLPSPHCPVCCDGIAVSNVLPQHNSPKPFHKHIFLSPQPNRRMHWLASQRPPDARRIACRLLLNGPKGGGVFGALASPGQPTHPPTSEKCSLGKKINSIAYRQDTSKREGAQSVNRLKSCEVIQQPPIPHPNMQVGLKTHKEGIRLLAPTGICTEAQGRGGGPSRVQAPVASLASPPPGFARRPGGTSKRGLSLFRAFPAVPPPLRQCGLVAKARGARSPRGQRGPPSHRRLRDGAGARGACPLWNWWPSAAAACVPELPPNNRRRQLWSGAYERPSRGWPSRGTTGATALPPSIATPLTPAGD